jgi:hypothetical protein
MASIGDAVWRGPPHPEIASADRIVQSPQQPVQRGQQAIAQREAPPQSIGNHLVEQGVAMLVTVGRQQVDPLGRAVHRAEVWEIPELTELDRRSSSG